MDERPYFGSLRRSRGRRLGRAGRADYVIRLMREEERARRWCASGAKAGRDHKLTVRPTGHAKDDGHSHAADDGHAGHRLLASAAPPSDDDAPIINKDAGDHERVQVTKVKRKIATHAKKDVRLGASADESKDSAH